MTVILNKSNNKKNTKKKKERRKRKKKKIRTKNFTLRDRVNNNKLIITFITTFIITIIATFITLIMDFMSPPGWGMLIS